MLDIVPKAYAACDVNQEGLKLTDCFLLNPQQTVGEVYKDPATLVNLIVRLLFIGGGIIVFLMFIYAGYQLISDPTSKSQEKAKSTLTSAIGGLIVMFVAFWILQIIKVITGADLLL